MIKTLSFCLAVVMLCYIAFVGHYYYETFSTFTGIEHSQGNSATPAP
ncbi:hypothetical protein IBT47_09720 [Erwinia sp. S43]|nr:hypothetical protein [Erwinia sp. S43]MBK0032561.1 hypothetical protein [Erwinia sp. S43]